MNQPNGRKGAEYYVECDPLCFHVIADDSFSWDYWAGFYMAMIRSTFNSEEMEMFCDLSHIASEMNYGIKYDNWCPQLEISDV